MAPHASPVSGKNRVFLSPSLELGHWFAHPQLPQPLGDAQMVVSLPTAARRAENTPKGFAVLKKIRKILEDKVARGSTGSLG